MSMICKINTSEIPGRPLSFFHALFGICTAFYGLFLVHVVTSEGSTRISASLVSIISNLLVWICNSLIKNNKIGHLHKRYLLLIHNEKQSLFHELLENDIPVSNHKWNLCFIVIKIIFMEGTTLTLVREICPLNTQNR